MHKLTSEWKCDRCGDEAHCATPSHPKGWQELALNLNNGNPPMKRWDFCSQEHMDEWLKAHGLEAT